MPYWTESENALFFKLLSVYGKDFQQIAECMNKSYTQVRSHFYNIQVKESKAAKQELKETKNITPLLLHFIVFDYIQ
ncbi:SANT/Myb_domain [Hexamita inflata]|uniref:SANT/Myb domain n=1 Tax=Hexamita inflata TaxID=28002 RepID=A0AA86PI83_9EUKA|nr:SANT/Myb domain [Hexamita inflata]